MEKSNRIAFLSAIIICMLAMPVMADYNNDGWPVETRVNGTVNGGVFHDSIGWTETTSQTLVTDVPNGTVKYAYLYTGVWGGHSTGWVNVSFNGDSTSNKLGPIHLEETSDGNDNVWCTGLGKYWLWYNVTNLVNTGQVNTATTSKINGSIDGRIYGIVLVVVYEGGDDPKQIQYWINDGSDALSSTNPTGTTNFVGTVNTDNIAIANLTMVHLTGYKPICSNCTKFNDNELDTSGISTNEFDMHTWNVTNYMEASGNDAWFNQGLDAHVNICNTILTVEYEPELNTPDLNVNDVLVNPGNERYEDIVRVYVNQSNNISAVVYNNGPEDVTDDFDVCFEADGVNIGCATVTGGLSSGANTTISIDWTPTCANYPVMPGFPAQSLPLTINVTVDCNCSNCPTCPDGSCGTITESDETNNIFSKVIPAIQVYNTINVIGGVVDNGYKSKNLDCDTTEEPLDQFKYYNLIGGGVEYNVSGVKISSFNPEATDTRIHQIDLPSGATVKDARLYVYWYDKWYNFDTYPTGCLANLSVNFSGTDLIPDTVYQDSKSFGFYQSPKGSSVFNVTSLMSGSGDYTAIVKNIEPIGGNGTTLLGEMLVVIYDGADHGNEVQIWMLEGIDYLMAADDTHGSKDFSVSPEEATATVALSGGTIDPANVNTARLITVVAQGMELGSDMLFNGNVIKADAWDTPTEAYPGSKINVENVSVKSNLLESGNNMGFQDNGTTGMQASNAILIVETPVIVETPLPDLVVSNIYPQYVFTNLTNVLSVNVMNQGTASTASCNVSLNITHTGGPTVLTATVPALNASESTVVEVGNWKPTVLENISMTAFVDSGGVVDEGSNEGNNDLTVSRNTIGDCAVDDMLPDTCFGYRGDNPMTTAYEGTGGVIYSVGDFKYKNNTVSFSIGSSGDENQVDGSTAEVPTSATIKNATLYVYYTYRKSATGPNSGADPRPDYEMSINGGSTLTTDEYYTDIKGFTTSEYQYGTLVYDVTDNVTGNSAYQVVRSNCNNTDPVLKGKGYVSGMALMIIYDDGSDNTYSIAHGYDRLSTFYSTQYKVLPEDAATTATLTDVDPNLIVTVNMLTVTVDAVASGSESQQFNTGSWEVGAWDCIAGVPTCDWNYPLGINRGAVDKSDVTASGTDEVVKFQEGTSNGFAPVFACLQTVSDTLDTIEPVINSVTLDPTDPNTGDTITVTVNATDNVGVTTVTADGVSLSNAGGDDIWEGTITAIEGTHTVNISASDAAANTAYDETANYTATTLTDMIAPVINSVTLDPTDPNTGDNITVTVNSTDNIGVTAVTADGVSLSNADGDDTWEGTITAIEGTYTVNISASDAAGNTVYDETANYTATPPPADNITPMINSVTLDPTDPNTGDNITVTVNATDNVGVTAVTADGVSLSNAGGDDTWEGTITAIEGTHTVNISVSDAAGNTVYDETANYTATPPADAMAPVINSVTLYPTDPNTGDDITVTVNATDNVEVTAVTADGVSLSNAGGDDTWEGTIIAIEGTHTVNISASDAAANTAYDETANYTATPPPADNITPVINSVTLDPTDPNTGDNITVTVNATDNVGVTAVTADGVSLNNADGDDTWEGIIIAISGTHTVNISASDAAANTAYDETANYTATTPVPTLPVVLVEDVTAAPNGYAFTSVMVKNVTGLGSGSITVTYNTSVVHVTNVTSGDGNALVVQDWNIDNSNGSLEITAWDVDELHNDDVVFAHVTFHAVGEYPDSTPLAISSSELIDYTSYDIIGHSVANGTFSILDKEPPVITDAIATLDVILNDNGRPRVPGTNVTVLNATVLDSESGVVNVTIDLSPIGGSDDQVMDRIVGTDVWTVATTATDGINLTHELVVTATDGADNTNTSVIELTVLLRGDVVRDGDLNSADSLYIAKYLVGKEPMPSLLVSDMSPAQGDGKITSADALYLAKYLVGNEAAP